MSAERQVVQSVVGRMSANDRFKQGFGSLFWIGLSLAVLIHFGIFAFFPEMSAADVSFTVEEFEAITLPPEVEIPPPPEPIARPATPVISDAVIDEDITIAPTTFEDNPIEDLPPPPTQQAASSEVVDLFMPMDVPPRLLNAQQLIREIERRYPPLLRDNGIGGRTVYHFYINEQGKPVRFQVAQSSGHEQLDKLMDQLWSMLEFSPAIYRDNNVPVWIELPVTYSAR